jgi:adenine-specific DNA-methyltransferase
MARIDELIDLVEDTALHRELQAATAELKWHRRSGLVFEEHIPETTALLGYPLRPGATVQRRDDPAARNFYRVLDVQGEAVSIVSSEGKGTAQTCPAAEVMVVQRLGEPIFPSLTPVGKVMGGGNRPYHAVINGENYHVLQLLVYLYEGQVDALYVDSLIGGLGL